jgi:hypothetical protein
MPTFSTKTLTEMPFVHVVFLVLIREFKTAALTYRWLNLHITQLSASK